MSDPPEEFTCPRCGGHERGDLRLPNGILLHWVLNPGVAINEILLGQRLPKHAILCKGCSPRSGLSGHESGYVPCPRCGRLHPGELWSGGTAFGNWIGYACPDCEASIPCLWNLTSVAVLVATAPVWALPVWLLHDRWRKSQARRIRNKREGLLSPELPLLRWGIASGLVISLVVCSLIGLNLALEGQLQWRDVLSLIAGGVFGGLGFGLLWGGVLESLTRNRKKLAAVVHPEGHVPVVTATARPTTGDQAGRCPYCHEDVAAAEAVACTSCLARHHPACWDDHSECASCASTTRYGAVEETEGRERPRPRPGKGLAG